jgi:uncharacterized delta-60 repeat protein
MLTSFLRGWRRGTGSAKRPPARGRFQPRLEALEERRLLTVGALDPAFGSGGLATPTFTVAGHQEILTPYAMAVQADGKIVLAVEARDLATGGPDMAVARCNADGSPDTRFGTGGIALVDFSPLDSDQEESIFVHASAVALQPDGKIIVAGALSGVAGVARLNLDGSLDKTFGTGGEVAVGSSTGPFTFAALAVQPDGKVVVGGSAGSPSTFALARLTAGGQVDPQFGHGHLVVGPQVGGPEVGYTLSSLAIQADGKIVAAGTQYLTQSLSPVLSFTVARYLPDGTPDAGFGHGGAVTTDFHVSVGNGTFTDARGSAVALQADGKIVVAGTAVDPSSFPGSNPDALGTPAFAGARYASDGQLDASFGSGGRLVNFIGATANGVDILRDGTIVLAGQFGDGGFFELAALDAPGNLDPRWGTGGTTTLDFHGKDAVGVGVTPGGDVVLAGGGVGILGSSGIALAAYQGPQPLPPHIYDAAKAFTHSKEHYTQFVVNAYQQYLKRTPDAAGLNFWVSHMQAGTYSDEQVEAFFIGSAEYIANHGGTGQGWVTGMYQDLLGRTPTAAEVQAWVNALNAGTPATAVALGFAASPEREGQRVRGNYQTYLGRAPSTAEVEEWVNAFVGGVSNEDMVAGFVGSPEYFANPQKGQDDWARWISEAYQDVLARPAAANEIASWLQFLQ